MNHDKNELSNRARLLRVLASSLVGGAKVFAAAMLTWFFIRFAGIVVFYRADLWHTLAAAVQQDIPFEIIALLFVPLHLLHRRMQHSWYPEKR